MNREQFDVIVEETKKSVKQLLFVKGGEYAPDLDRLANFKHNATILKLLPEQVWAVYFNKHVDAIHGAINDLAAKKVRPRSESILGRMDDAIVYLILAKALFIEREQQAWEVAAKSFDTEDKYPPTPQQEKERYVPPINLTTQKKGGYKKK